MFLASSFGKPCQENGKTGLTSYQGSTACLLLDFECERQQNRNGIVYTIDLMKALPAKDANGRNEWKTR